MGRHDSIIDLIIESGERFSSRVSELKNFLAFTSSSAVIDSNWTSSSRDARALALICTAAELEALTKSTVQECHKELNRVRVPILELIPSVRQLVAHATFESLRDLQDHGKLWEQRGFATTLENCRDIAQFPLESKRPQPPLDGRTLKPEHFYRMWSIYSLPGEAFSDVSWPGSLLKLASARNDLAHGNLPYMEIFQQAGRASSDVEKYLDDVAAFADHFVANWCEYLDEEKYLAANAAPVVKK